MVATGASQTAHLVARGLSTAPQDPHRTATPVLEQVVSGANMHRGAARCYDCQVNDSAVVATNPGLVQRIAAVIRRIIGVPDYDRYCLHVAAVHPGEKPVSRDEFFRSQQEGKYTRPGSRCC
jgi:uncharacterized short protein YbdD (DUF466 family)